MNNGNSIFLLSVLSIIIASYALIQSNKNIEFIQYQIIMNMYSNLQDLERDLFKYRAGSYEESLGMYELTQEIICNHYEIYCTHYQRKSINKRLFKDLFSANIIRIVNNLDYADFFNRLDKSKYDYCEILKTYDEFKGII